MDDTLGEQIRAARKALRKSQAEVAEALGVSTQAVSQWETDKTVPARKNLSDLYELLNIKPSVFHTNAFGNETVPVLKAPLMDWKNVDSWSPIVEWLELDVEKVIPRRTHPIPERFLDVYWRPIGDVYALRLGRFQAVDNFEDGDDIIIDTGRQAERGDYVVVLIEEYGSTGQFGRFFPKGIDEYRAPIFEVRFGTHREPYLVDNRRPGRVVGVVREQRKYYRMS